MRTFMIITVLLLYFTTYGQAQKNTTSSDQVKTIEINNSNGELLISFKNSVITDFIVNDSPVPEERYDDYQEIIDLFSEEDLDESSLEELVETEEDDENQSENLRILIVDYLTKESIINSATKYQIELKRNFLKVDGQMCASKTHQRCLEFFDEIYGERLNFESAVKFKKSKNNSTSTVRIVD